MATFEAIKLDVNNGLAVITLNRPDKLNALTALMKKELLFALRKINSQQSGVRALLITGAGRGFCPGADLGEGVVDSGSDLIDSYHPVLLEISALEIPVICAVNGVAAGAGMSIAISGDIVIAAESATFLQAFINIGLVPDAGSTFILPRLIGQARAKAMMMLGEKVSAKTAYEWGMIHDVVPDEELQEKAMKIAQRLANGPTIALSSIRKLINSSQTSSYSEQLQNEALMQRKASQTKDCVEGVTAFIQKRKAAFTGQ